MEIPVGVVVERRTSNNQWIDFVWRPVTVLTGSPETRPWTVLKEDTNIATFYGGQANIELHVSETAQYRDNLATGEPALWVVLRPRENVPPYELLLVTANPSEGEAMTEPGTDLVEPVPMPDAIRDQIAAFVAQHHVEQPFFKRKRDRVNPETQGRNPPVRGSQE
jgi:hypothetical protein